MKRFMGLLGVVAIITGLVMFIPGQVAKAETRDLIGRGILYVRGSGVAELEGDGRVIIHSRGVGTVLVSGAENIVARGDGHRIDLPDGSVRFTGWEGFIRIEGRNMTVRMEGGKIEFRAIGRGEAHLRGKGIYRIGHLVGTWAEDGVSVQFEPES